MQFAEADDGARLAWREDGTGDPLLLISGQVTGLAGWDPIVPNLASTFRVIRFDHRGIGGSEEGSAESYSTRGFAADARAVLDAAGTKRAHVYGHSMGGRVAQWLAIDYPERTGALILAATSAGGYLGTNRDREATAALTSGDPSRLEPLFFDPDWASQHREAVHTFFTARAPRRAKRLHFRASSEHDARNLLSSVRAPTLILHGTADVVTPLGNALALKQYIPGSMLARVPKGRHGFHLDRPETLDWIRQFIARKKLQL
ncbi:alpha/beta fold hydrolase [Arthrobacter sp. JZ12]|uniref:alpha/beta fold hydrolase n=1 Tax=Arthrobacter sp. JZ12 TaxID=2654190 RepID=UPI002B48F4D0|nr:alpha/beta fold hydrolase [Arthrobacter sp. JZ12]WRH23908.1 alpha/beta fold hydrolase [Arthrobacter sp. JZ12]